ncbi:LuxR C-terminal-related transcriptional regulator [Yersinia bercovieri]|uniref:LuxR C-terminal-related transcriptional regulator n=1 Tax=Yersinia bercovieri TaxID=634 RepID=UPI003B96DE4B
MELLTGREYQIVRSIFSGGTVKELSAKLNLSNKTISGHKINALWKMRFSRHDLFHHAVLLDGLCLYR